MSLMLRRRMLLSQVETEQGLPTEYQQVEYILIKNDDPHGRKNGFETKIAFANADKLEFKISSIATLNNMMLITSDKIAEPFLTINRDKPLFSGFTTCELIPSNVKMPDIADGNEYEFQVNYTSNSNDTIRFGGWKDPSYSRSISWFYFKIYSGNELIANFIPCYRKIDNKVGFYDSVSGKFHEGTTAFYKGGDI